LKILVCGSEGRLMSEVIPHLLAAGHEVWGIDSCEKWGVQAKRRDYVFIRGNCASPEVMRPLLEGVDGVIQATATLAGVIGFHRRAADILSNDLSAHANVLRLSVQAKVGRVVYVSSSMVYERHTSQPLREDDEELRLARTDYGLSKLVGERMSLAFWNQYRLPYTIWRPFNVIDPQEAGSDDVGVSHVFADFTHRLVGRQQNPLEILGNGCQTRSFAHIREIGEAIARFSFAPSTLNEVFNLGNPELITMRELAQKIYQKAQKRGLIRSSRPLEFKPLPVVETDVKQRVGDFTKARRALGWEARIGIDEAIEECLDCFVAHRTMAAACASRAISSSEEHVLRAL
jgi:UDP-glucose 4-epimerase